MKSIVVSGKRKTAIARAVITEGSGKIFLNGKEHKTLNKLNFLKIEEPLRIAREITGNLNFDVKINIKGGGEKSQIEAARVALSKAIVKFTKSKKINDAFLEYDRNLLVADVRRKEAYKPGDSKARKKRQSSKR